MTQPTLRDVLRESSDHLSTVDLGTRAVAEARRRIRRRRFIGGAAAVTATVVALAATVGIQVLDTPSTPEPATPPGQPADPLSGENLAGAWQFLGEPRAIRLRNHYHAVTVYAFNRSTRRVPGNSVSVQAAYLNETGRYSAGCDVYEFEGRRPSTRSAWFDESKTTLRYRAQIEPGEKVFFVCLQVVGPRPFGDDVRVDTRSVRFIASPSASLKASAS